MAKEIRKRLLSIEITGPTAFPGAGYCIWSANPISDAYVRLLANLRPLVHKGGLGAYGVWCIRVTTAAAYHPPPTAAVALAAMPATVAALAAMPGRDACRHHHTPRNARRHHRTRPTCRRHHRAHALCVSMRSALTRTACVPSPEQVHVTIDGHDRVLSLRSPPTEQGVCYNPRDMIARGVR